ncbi:MAG: AAA family ATPase, partial [bacterium]
MIDDVKSILIDRDDKYECFILALQNCDGTRYEARSLSDGTLRFLALATLAEDPSALGVICMEEPQNGIQPSRNPAILKLLKAIPCDPTIEEGEDKHLL